MKSTNKAVRQSDSAEKRRRKKLFQLANRFRNTSDQKEAKRLGDELGRMVFGA
jgi:hypothetical protein